MFRNNHSGKAKLAVIAGFVTEAFIRSNTAAEEASVPNSSNPCQWDSNWDMRKPNKNKVVHQIVMVRHGQYDRDGKTDAENILTAVGREQAEATGKRLDILLRSGQIQPVKNIYYSTMARATETCKLILPQISNGAVITDLPSTSTINTNIYTALGDDESVSVPHSTTVQACSMIREGAVCAPNPPCTGWNPTDEDFEKEGTRVLAAFKNHVHRADKDEVDHYSTVLVCHGNVIRYLVMKSLQLPPEAWLRLNVYNGSITIIEIRANGNVSLRTLADTGHLPPSLMTYN